MYLYEYCVLSDNEVLIMLQGYQEVPEMPLASSSVVKEDQANCRFRMHVGNELHVYIVVPVISV